MRSLLVMIALLCATPVFAQDRTMTARQEARAADLYQEIRCPVCTAQAVAESDATVSLDLRRRIDALIIAGKTDEQVLQEVSRVYGDDIRLRPKREPRTWPLFALPWLIVGFGALWLWRRGRRT